MRDTRGHYLETISEIDLSSFRRNIKQISEWVDDRTIILAVKGNAYGHGVVPICREALKMDVNHFGVANLTEAVELRDSGINSSIILLTPPTIEQVPSIVFHDIKPNVVSLEFAELLSAQSTKSGKITKCHVEIDTGMGRSGLFYEDALGDLCAIEKLSGIEIEGIFSHFPVADSTEIDDIRFTERQLDRFASIIEKYKALGYQVPLVHISNSAGIIAHPIYGNAVRPGIMAYGQIPAPGMVLPFPLESVMTLKTEIVSLRFLPSGWNVSYGRNFTTTELTRIATIRCGYGDGLRRCLSNQGYVLIRGRRFPIVGTICMDTTMVAIDDDTINQDDEVVVLGKQGGETITATDHASFCNTISYEILTGISERVKRLYIRDGLVVGES
jgi:alanine racemase